MKFIETTTVTTTQEYKVSQSDGLNWGVVVKWNTNNEWELLIRANCENNAQLFMETFLERNPRFNQYPYKVVKLIEDNENVCL